MANGLNFGPDATKRGGFWEVPINEVIVDLTLNTSRAYDPRNSKRGKDALLELGQSINTVGQEAPCLCDLVGGKPRVRVGFRRALAQQLVKESGMVENPKLLIEIKPNDSDFRELNATENRERENLTPMDVAALCENYRKGDPENGVAALTNNEIAAKLGVKPAYVSKHLAFLKAPAKVQKMLAQGYLSENAGYLLYQLGEKRDETIAALFTAYDITEEDLDRPAEEVAKEKSKKASADSGEEEIPDLPSGKPGKADKNKKPGKPGKTSKAKAGSKRGMITEKEVAEVAAKTGATKTKANKVAGKSAASAASGVTRRVQEIRTDLLSISEDMNRSKWERRMADRLMAYIGSVIDIETLGKEFGKCCKVSESAAKAAAEAA